MSSFPYVDISNIFNTADYNILNEGLTINTADKLYLSLGGGTITGSLNVTGNLSATTLDVTPSNRTLGGISFTNVLACSNTSRYFCTRQPTADTFVMLSYAAGGVQTDAMSWAAIGTTLSITGSLNLSSNLVMGANTISAAEIGVLDGVTPGIAVASKALVLDGGSDILGIDSLSATSLMGTFVDSTQPTNITGASPISAYGSSLRRFTVTNGDNCGMCFAVTNSSLVAKPGATLTFTRTGANSYGYLSVNTQPTPNANLTETMRIDPVLVTINTDLTVDPSKTISGFLSTPNQSAITSVGTLDQLGIGTSNPNDGYLCITGSTLGYTDGSFNMAVRLIGANATPVKAKLLVSNNTAGTSTNSMWLGTETNNDIIFGTNNATKMTLTAAGRLGIGVSAPAVPLDVSGSVSVSIDVGGTGYASYGKTGIASTGLGPISIATSIKASNAVWSLSSFYASSDRRLKEYIQPVHEEDVEAFLDVEPVYFNIKGDSTVQIGYIAQDVAKAGMQKLVNFLPREGLDIEDSDWDLQDVQLGIDYSRVSAVLHVIIKKQARQIEKLEADIAAVFRMLEHITGPITSKK